MQISKVPPVSGERVVAILVRDRFVEKEEGEGF